MICLNRGVCSCALGPDAGRIEVAFDWLAVEAELAGRPYVEDVLMTTSHERESLDDALWFAVFVAFPPEGEARAVLAVCDPEWSGEVSPGLSTASSGTLESLVRRKPKPPGSASAPSSLGCSGGSRKDLNERVASQ